MVLVLKGLTRKINGDARPKQFRRIFGDRSLLSSTRERLKPMTNMAEGARLVMRNIATCKEKNMIQQAHSIWFKADVDWFDTLVDLALNLRWSWSHGEEELWEPLDPELWELTHNPWLVLLTTSLSRLKSLMADPNYRRKVEEAARTKQDYMQAPNWFQQKHAQSPLSCVAYFSMEFMLSEALPIYSGGLGNVAGDQLKASSDVRRPGRGCWAALWRVIFGRCWMPTERSAHSIPTTIRGCCQSFRCAMRTVSGFG